MKESGQEVRLGAAHDRVEKLSDGMLRVHLKDGSSVTVEKVLLAIGRPPATDGLGLEQTEVQVDKRGNVVVDEY